METKDYPAFPCKITDGQGDINQYYRLSRREYFAAIAMQGLIAQHNPGPYNQADAELTARYALMLGDSLLKALENDNN